MKKPKIYTAILIGDLNIEPETATYIHGAFESITERVGGAMTLKQLRAEIPIITDMINDGAQDDQDMLTAKIEIRATIKMMVENKIKLLIVE